MGEEMARRLSAWLCPTALHRARMLDNSARIQRARAITVVAVAVTLLSFAPTYGWWTLVLFGLAGLNMGTLDRRIARSAHPQLHVAASLVIIQGVLAAAVALSGGPDSIVLPWLVMPTAFSAARFRGAVVVADVVIGVIMMLAATLGTDASGFLHRPGPVLIATVLLISVTAAVYVLSAAEVEHRGDAVLDHLTGLLNRSSLESRFNELAELAALRGDPISIVVLDVDAFKAINDKHGHAGGDAVLRDLALELRQQLRSFELVYRLGGEEFLLLLPGTNLQQAARVAERLRAALEQARPGNVPVTASFGVAAGNGATRFDVLFAAADASLYRAKAAGRNRVDVAPAFGPRPLAA
jgi:diguanylate cyclase (GGDEF)-like protein